MNGAIDINTHSTTFITLIYVIGLLSVLLTLCTINHKIPAIAHDKLITV